MKESTHHPIRLTLLATCLFLLVGCSPYEKKNDLLSENLKGKVESYSEYTYTAVEKFGETVKGEMTAATIRTYNTAGNLTEVNHYDDDGSLERKWKFKYDDNGIRTEGNLYKYDGTLLTKWDYDYDDKGNRTAANRIAGNRYELQTNTERAEYTYDDKGYRTGLNHYDSDGTLLLKWEYKHDGKGNQTEADLHAYGGAFYSKIKYNKYDDKGNYTEKSRYNSDGALLSTDTYVYTYDSKGNWLKRITYEDGVATEVCEREYRYY